MIKQVIDIDGYWKVIVYYNVDYNFFECIADDLYDIDITDKVINRIHFNMYHGYAKAVTITNKKYKSCVVLFNVHDDKDDYINSIVHEAEHVKQAILKYYNVDDEGEPPAYTIGYIVMKMLESKIHKFELVK